jgi:hypothetical protein
MARPAPERSRSALPLRQLSRFCYLINSDIVFGTHNGSIEGLHLKEFFLLLSSTGLAYRRCELAWVNGDQIGAKFITRLEKKKPNKAVLAISSSA